MAEILGLGVSHYLPMSGLDEDMDSAHRGHLKDLDIPASAMDPTSWSELAKRMGSPCRSRGHHRAYEDMTIKPWELASEF